MQVPTAAGRAWRLLSRYGGPCVGTAGGSRGLRGWRPSRRGGGRKWRAYDVQSIIEGEAAVGRRSQDRGPKGRDSQEIHRPRSLEATRPSDHREVPAKFLPTVWVADQS